MLDDSGALSNQERLRACRVPTFGLVKFGELATPKAHSKITPRYLGKQ